MKPLEKCWEEFSANKDFPNEAVKHMAESIFYAGAVALFYQLSEGGEDAAVKIDNELSERYKYPVKRDFVVVKVGNISNMDVN